MKFILLEERKDNGIIDYKNNIERLRKIRGLNLKKTIGQYLIRTKTLSFGERVTFRAPDCEDRP